MSQFLPLSVRCCVDRIPWLFRQVFELLYRGMVELRRRQCRFGSGCQTLPDCSRFRCLERKKALVLSSNKFELSFTGICGVEIECSFSSKQFAISRLFLRTSIPVLDLVLQIIRTEGVQTLIAARLDVQYLHLKRSQTAFNFFKVFTSLDKSFRIDLKPSGTLNGGGLRPSGLKMSSKSSRGWSSMAPAILNLPVSHQQNWACVGKLCKKVPLLFDQCTLTYLTY